jgi:ferredoxin
LTFVITKACIGVKDASCLDVCPVRCIATTDEEEMYHIDAAACINCTYCEPVCPVNAIFDEFKMPPDQREFLRRNREFFKNNP